MDASTLSLGLTRQMPGLLCIHPIIQRMQTDVSVESMMNAQICEIPPTAYEIRICLWACKHVTSVDMVLHCWKDVGV